MKCNNILNINKCFGMVRTSLIDFHVKFISVSLLEWCLSTTLKFIQVEKSFKFSQIREKKLLFITAFENPNINRLFHRAVDSWFLKQSHCVYKRIMWLQIIYWIEMFIKTKQNWVILCEFKYTLAYLLDQIKLQPYRKMLILQSHYTMIL